MSKNTVSCVLALLALCLMGGAASAWTTVGDGIEYQAFTAAGPNNLFVTRMARANTNTTIDTSIAYDMMSGAAEIVRNQAARQDDAITWWGGSWGARNDVVCAINGGFFDIGGTNIISGGQIQSGWYAHWFSDLGSFSGFAWRTDRTPFAGECVDHTPAKVYVKFVSNGNTQAIDGINTAPGGSDLIIFTPQYDNQTPSGTRTEVLVEMSRPNLTTSGSGYSSGIIRSVGQNTGLTWIPFDHIVLSADGDEGTTLKNNSTVGSEVRIFQELVETNEPDVQGNYGCQTATGRDWSNAFASINSNYHFLENNVVRVPDAVAHPGYLGYVNLNPRTAICWNSTYVFFVICDGRTTSSVGMSCATLGNWAKTTLGATDGVNNDGGGSSTMVVNGSVMNHCSDGSERAVCNGIMMVNVLPKEQTTTFSAGQTVTTDSSASLRLGPGSNYGLRTTIASGATGVVQSHSLNGVRAKSDNWWKVSFSGIVGWVGESYLVGGGSGCTPPSITTQPAPTAVCTGSTAAFSVVCSGTTPLTYQWQRSTNGGSGYSNVTTGTGGTTALYTTEATTIGMNGYLYRCQVTGQCVPVATSNGAVLAVNACSQLLQNPGFEEGATSGVGNGWTTYLESGSTGAWTIQTANPAEGVQYQQIQITTAGMYGGVYQTVTGCTIGATYTLSGFMRTNSANATVSVLVAPSGSTSRASAIALTPAAGTSSTTFVPFSGNVTATGTSMTVFLDTDVVNVNKAGAFDGLSLMGAGCSAPAAPADGSPTADSATGITWKWTDVATETGYRVKDTGGTNKSGDLAAATVQWSESSLTPNTSYTRKIYAFNTCGESTGSTGQTKYTLAKAGESTDGTGATGNVYCTSASKSTWYGGSKAFVFSNPSGFGTGGTWKASSFEYKWNKVATETWSAAGAAWTSGTVSLTANAGDGDYYLHVRALNGSSAANNTDVLNYGPFKSDATAPSTVTVTDEGTYTPSQNTLKASWTASTDAGSGLKRYDYAIGTSSTTQNIRGWTSAGTSTTISATGLTLADGTKYYVQARAVDNVDNLGSGAAANGITVAPGVSPISYAWDKANTTDPLSLRNKIVTAVIGGAFWLEETSRTMGIKVVSSASVARGNSVSVAGVLGLSGAQRALIGDVVVNAGGSTTIQPLAVSGKSLGGANFNLSTPGITGGKGLYNIGLLVKVFGSVTYSNTANSSDKYFYLDDGSGLSRDGHAGVLIRCGSLTPPSSGMRTVTGIVASELSGSNVVPVILIRDLADIIQP